MKVVNFPLPPVGEATASLRDTRKVRSSRLGMGEILFYE